MTEAWKAQSSSQPSGVNSRPRSNFFFTCTSMLRTMMSPTCSSLTQAPISSWQRSASVSFSGLLRHLGEIELDRRVLAVDAVVEGGQRLDLLVVGLLVELDDALQHDLDGLADAHHLARGVGQRLAWRVERAFGQRGEFGRGQLLVGRRRLLHQW